MKKGELKGPSPLEVGFDSSYEGVPPWDIGRPQPEFVKLLDQGKIRGKVLDIGCGTGENALFLASRGHESWGIDVVPSAIAKAKEKARERKIEVQFQIADALHLEKLGMTFDTVIDSGLFHIFSDENRPLFVQSVRSVLKPGGNYIFLCFSDREPGTWGPRRITQEEIRKTFQEGWKILEIQSAIFETNFDEAEVQAWLVILEHL